MWPRPLLWPFSALYAGGVYAFNLYYDRVPSAAHRAQIPVISVGNLTAGGTGKTPVVMEITQRLRKLGCRPAILTRGYKAPPGAPADEVRELLAALPDVPVIVNPDRVAGAALARAAHAADCLVLDDGFQHRRLARDLDLVLIDALAPWGGGALLPAGRLREPLRALRRADLFVITRVNQAPTAVLEAIEDVLQQRAPGRPIVHAGVLPDALVSSTDQRRPAADLHGRAVLCVSGIGNPRTFELLVATLVAPRATLRFPDHCQYSAAHVSRILARARDVHAEQVVTTRKDWVKLAPLWPDTGPGLVRLDMRLTLAGDVAALEARLRQCTEKPQ